MDAAKIAALEAAAEKATPGERGCYDGFGPLDDGLMRCHYIGIAGERILSSDYEEKDLTAKQEDFEFIALCSRETILALIAKLKAQARVVEAARSLIAAVVAVDALPKQGER